MDKEISNEGEEGSSGPSLLQRWFPLWGGWYQAQPAPSEPLEDSSLAATQSSPSQEASRVPPPSSLAEQSSLETEIMDALAGFGH